MAVTAVTTYYVDVGSTRIKNTSGEFYGTPEVLGGGTRPDTTIYKVGKWIIGFGETVWWGGHGPKRVLPGTVLGNYTWYDSWGHHIGGSSITATGGSFVTNEGQRIITLKAVGGNVASPSLAGGGEIVPTGWAFPVGDISAHTSFATITAGNGLPNTGTLTARGYAEGVWDRWSWTSGVITSGSDPTEKTIVVSLFAGYGDGEVKANFTRPQNSASVWSPKLGNMVIHVLDGNLSETHLSTSYTASDTKWSEFLTIAKFTALSCSAGGKTRHWRSKDQYDDTAYLLNVDAATFSVTPGTGMRVYGWKLEPAPIDGVAQAMVDFGSNTSALISGFEEGCKVHLYLTSAGPNPRVVYDGFDDTGDVPANEAVTATGTGFTATSATQWVSNSAAPVEITLAPAAWAARVLGQSRSVIKDDGAPVPLANVDGTSASILSSTAQFSVTHVKFKQTQLDTDGLLTVTIVEDTITPVDGISVQVSQENTPLGTLT
ncbi:MAG TPA: hypothetical protein PKJ78_21685, partial [Candidatus Hydrogenedentes bacterium]|nr:hypothetical protein [Candidatus Hydrogenedentota bacterium]